MLIFSVDSFMLEFYESIRDRKLTLADFMHKTSIVSSFLKFKRHVPYRLIYHTKFIREFEFSNDVYKTLTIPPVACNTVTSTMK